VLFISPLLLYRNHLNLIHLIFVFYHDLLLFLNNLVFLEQDDIIYINQVFDFSLLDMIDKRYLVLRILFVNVDKIMIDPNNKSFND
jgi:hypothetical protein